jgi:hypothetical protein
MAILCHTPMKTESFLSHKRRQGRSQMVTAVTVVTGPRVSPGALGGSPGGPQEGSQKGSGPGKGCENKGRSSLFLRKSKKKESK